MMVVGGWGAVSVGQAGVHTYPVQGHTKNIKLAASYSRLARKLCNVTKEPQGLKETSSRARVS